MVGGGGERDGERMPVADDIVLESVFDKELQAEGNYLVVEVARVDVLFYYEVFAEAYLHHLAVGIDERELVVEVGQTFALHDVAVGGGELLQILLCLFVVVPYQGAEGVE